MKTKKQRNNHKLQKKKKHKTPRKQIKMKGGNNEAKLDTMGEINSYYDNEFKTFIQNVHVEDNINNRNNLIMAEYLNIKRKSDSNTILYIINNLLYKMINDMENYENYDERVIKNHIGLIENRMVQLMTPNFFDHYLNFGFR